MKAMDGKRSVPHNAHVNCLSLFIARHVYAQPTSFSAQSAVII